VSPCPTPSKTSHPSPISPTLEPSTSTRAELTRCRTARTRIARPQLDVFDSLDALDGFESVELELELELELGEVDSALEADVSVLAAALDELPLLEEEDADELLRESVMYQPLPLKTMPTG
jgi:hypothetical protein